MAERSSRGRRSPVGPLLLALILLTVLGAGAGFSLGTLARDAHTDGGASGTTGTAGTEPTADTDPETTTNPTNTNTDDNATDNTAARCPKHTEDQAGTGALTRVLYLHTAQSEVWICRSG